MDIMQERGSICVHVLLAELRWLGGNGPAEYPSLTLILLPLLQLLQISAVVPTYTVLIKGHLHTYTRKHIS